jgi:serine phosphatase RsbU (regulator of sigma subunit)
MSPATEGVVSGSTDAYALQCMEIWSGNERFESAISVPGIDAWVCSEPYEGKTAGGDVHYVSTCGHGRVSRFVVADVSGHGADVGPLAGRLRRLMRKHINTLDQTRFAKSLNHEFAELAHGGHFATALLTTYSALTDHLIVCNIGHPRPLWYRVREARWEVVQHDMPQRAEVVMNLPLGVVEPTDYAQFAVPLARGDLVMIYTDALVESENRAGEELGERGLLELVRGLDVSDLGSLNARVLEAVRAYRGGAPSEDDQTLMVLHHNAADPPRQTLGEKMKVMGKMFGLIDY